MLQVFICLLALAVGAHATISTLLQAAASNGGGGGGNNGGGLGNVAAGPKIVRVSEKAI